MINTENSCVAHILRKGHSWGIFILTEADFSLGTGTARRAAFTARQPLPSIGTRSITTPNCTYSVAMFRSKRCDRNRAREKKKYRKIKNQFLVPSPLINKIVFSSSGSSSVPSAVKIEASTKATF